MTAHGSDGEAPGKVLIVAGSAEWRSRVFSERAQRGESLGHTTLTISLSLAHGGPWGGLREIFLPIVESLEDTQPELVGRHRYELTHILPELRLKFPLSEASLTDGGPVKERVRSFPMNRAFRLVHGLIDLLDAYQSHPSRHVLWLGLDDFDQAGALNRHFSLELIRRLGDRPWLFIAVGCEPANLEEVKRSLPRGEVLDLAGFVTEDCAEGKDSALARLAMEDEARELEEALDANIRLVETRAPRLVWLWEHTGHSERALRWRIALLAIYNHFGYYEDALFFGEPVLPFLDLALQGEKAFSRWHVVSGLFNALVALGQAERAFELVDREALQKVSDLTDLISIHYAMAMLYARFLGKRDLAQAEHHLERSMSFVESAPLGDAEKCYLQAFNWNGLALIRHQQGRPEEALELCERGFASLRIHLSEEQHRLHRSVLLYNIAQVHSAGRNLPAAIEKYSEALAIDPNYSEYYNERGAAYFGIGETSLAIEDFLQAIRLSAPYPEVWVNLGQAFRRLGLEDKAEAAYSRTLDIDPSVALAWIGRAQARTRLGLLKEAVADYTEAIALDSTDPRLRSNRGALYFELGQFADSVADLDQALRLDPKNDDLRANQALALAALRAEDDQAPAADRCLARPGSTT